MFFRALSVTAIMDAIADHTIVVYVGSCRCPLPLPGRGVDDLVVGHVGYGPRGGLAVRPPRLYDCTPGGPSTWRRRLVAVHVRSVWDRYATRRLHDLLAERRWPRRSPQWDRQTTVTAQLNRLHPKRKAWAAAVTYRRPRLIEVRRRVA